MILVTGASGLVGLHLIKELSKQGNAVRAMYHSHIPDFLPDTNINCVTWIQADILDTIGLEKCFENISYVYHCAAMVSYDARYADTMMQLNETGTENIVNCCLDFNIKKLVFVSSISAIGKETELTLITENTTFSTTEYKPTQYAISKHKAEMQVWRGIAEGLNAVIVNPAVILGEGDTEKSSTNLFKIVYNEFPYYTHGATAWVDVQDVIGVMIMLMQSNVSSERFIISAVNCSYRDIFTMMAKAMHKKPPHIAASKWLTELVWRVSYIKSILTGKVATITKETARNAHEINRFDNQKFIHFFPQFHYQNIEGTIKRIVKNLYG